MCGRSSRMTRAVDIRLHHGGSESKHSARHEPPGFVCALADSDSECGGILYGLGRRHYPHRSPVGDLVTVEVAGDAERLGELAGSVREMVRSPPALLHDLPPLVRFPASEQYPGPVALPARHEVDAPVDAVGAVDIDVPGAEKHRSAAWREAPKGVRRRIRLVVGLYLVDPHRGDATSCSGLQSPSQESGRHLPHRPIQSLLQTEHGAKVVATTGGSILVVMPSRLTLVCDLTVPGSAVREVTRLRPMASGDLLEVAELYHSAYPPGVAGEKEDAIADVASSLEGGYGPLAPASTLVAVDQGIVGAIFTVWDTIWEASPRGPFIIDLFVAETHRRRGLARQLLGVAVNGLRAGGSRRVGLRVLEENGPARALYGRLGFVEWVNPAG